jgi:ADP-ribosylglycohydrolase
MIGAIAGDIIGSIYEWNNIKTTEFELFSRFCHFTDDSVLTVALADSILNNVDYDKKMREYYHRYPDAGYGGSFAGWARSMDKKAYNSWGNGAAMRISPAGFAYPTLEETLNQAEKFTVYTHNHPEGIKGACATTAAIFLARKGGSKTEIKDYIENTFGYDLQRTLDQIRPTYQFDVSCQGTIPEAIIAFLESVNFEDAIRKAVSLGGDIDTLACITGGIAQAFYGGILQTISDRVYKILDEPLGRVTREFMAKYCS